MLMQSSFQQYEPIMEAIVQLISSKLIPSWMLRSCFHWNSCLIDGHFHVIPSKFKPFNPSGMLILNWVYEIWYLMGATMQLIPMDLTLHVSVKLQANSSNIGSWINESNIIARFFLCFDSVTGPCWSCWPKNGDVLYGVFTLLMSILRVETCGSYGIDDKGCQSQKQLTTPFWMEIVGWKKLTKRYQRQIVRPESYGQLPLFHQSFTNVHLLQPISALRNFTVLSSLAEARGISGLSLDALTDYMQLSRRRLLPQETGKHSLTRLTSGKIRVCYRKTAASCRFLQGNVISIWDTCVLSKEVTRYHFAIILLLCKFGGVCRYPPEPGPK